MNPAARLRLFGAGPDIVVNGGFDSDTAWTKGTGWTISGGTANFTVTGSASNLFENVGLVLGALYEVTVLATRSAGGLSIFVGNGNITGFLTIGVSGFYTTRQRAAGDTVLYVQANSLFTGTVDNVTCRRIG